MAGRPRKCRHGKVPSRCSACKSWQNAGIFGRPEPKPHVIEGGSPHQYWVDELQNTPYQDTSYQSDPHMLFGREVPEGWEVDLKLNVVRKPDGNLVTFEMWRQHDCKYTLHEPGCIVCGRPADMRPVFNPFDLPSLQPGAVDLADLQAQVASLRPEDGGLAGGQGPEYLTIGGDGNGSLSFVGIPPQAVIPPPHFTPEEAMAVNGELTDPRTYRYDCECVLDMATGKVTQTWTWQGFRREQENLPSQFLSDRQHVIRQSYDYSNQHPTGAPMCTLAWTTNEPLLTPMGFPDNLASQPVPSQEDDTLIQYVLHSRPGKFAPPCGGCGNDQLYWAHEVPEGVIVSGLEPDYCERCKTFGQQVMVDSTPTPTGKYKPHSCQSAPGASGAVGDPGEVAPTSTAERPDDVEDLQGRPDLEGPEGDDDPWMSPEFEQAAADQNKKPCPNCNSEHSVDRNGCCDNCGEYMPELDESPGDLDPDEASNTSGGETDQDESPMPEPPWKQEGADPSQSPADPSQSPNGDGEGESEQEPPDPYVFRQEWFDARCSDGDWLKEYARRSYLRADNAFLHAQAAKTESADAIRRASQAAVLVKDTEERCKIRTDNLRKEVREWIDDLGEFGNTNGQPVTLVTPGQPDKPLPPLFHKDLPTLIKMGHARLHVLMVGPASVGKGKLAEQVAESITRRNGEEMPYYELPASLNPQTTVTQIMGYMEATGHYVPTLFRKAVEEGGVMFLDELDNAHPAALASINGILAKEAGRKVAFPDGMVTIHEDFVVMGAANTFGRGPNQTYAARQRGDAATWDRFNIISMEIDKALEMTLCSRTGAPARTVAEVVRFVRGLRDEAEKRNMPVVLGMRATIDMCKMLSAGVTLAEAVDARCRRGLSDQDWRNLTGTVRDMELEDA